jgi:hypothetical protein
MIRRATAFFAAAIFSAAAAALPKIESVVVRPNPAQFAGDKAPQVEIAISVGRGKFDKGSCDARLEFGDGQGRTLDFGMAATRTVHHVYKKDGSYTVAVRGAGVSPCEGSQQVALKVAGEPKKPQAKKADAEKKKAAPAKKKREPRKKAAKKKPKAG